MANVVILGGGFAGVVAAESLAKQLSDEHQITLVSRTHQFIFYPALVRLASGKCQTSDVSFDLRQMMLNWRVNFIEAEVARIDPSARNVTIAHGEVEGKLVFDYLVFALGRRLATERISGFYEYAHHLLNIDKALKFGKAIGSFREGSAVFGQCPDARLPVPVYESAFYFARLLEERGKRDKVDITIVSPTTLEAELTDPGAAVALQKSLDAHQINFQPNVSIDSLTRNSASTIGGDKIDFDLLMLVPPFRGSSAASYVGITNADGYINVDRMMRVRGQERMYAAGDCVNFDGPKLGHMAVRQADVVASNLKAEIAGGVPLSQYQHEMRSVIDGAGSDGLYLYKDLWKDEPGTVKQGRFWNWAKRVQEWYWEMSHS